MSDEAEAAKEIAKAAQPLTKALGQLVGDLLGPAFKEYGLAWGDRVGAWRERNAARMLERAQGKMRERRLEGHTLPPRFLLPALERAADVDEPELQDLWAELIANGAAAEDNQHPLFAETLIKMNSADARLLSNLVSKTPQHRVARGGINSVGVPEDPTMQRLISLGLVQMELGVTELGRTQILRRGLTRPAQVTGFGVQFARAVGIIKTPGRTL